jgi:predicted RNase H-like HicB family nuclease
MYCIGDGERGLKWKSARAEHVEREGAVEVTVFVEQLDEQTYRAETAQPISLVTEGRTRDEAIERLRALAQQRLTAGEMVRLEIPEVAAPHPWVPFAGIWKDHPDIDAVLEHIAEERRQRDVVESEA